MLTLAYRSEAMSLLPFSALADICLLSAKKNQRLGITGFLVEFEGVFLQVLEGEAEAVNALYGKIAADPRHHTVELLIRNQADVRPNFGFWAMNFGPLNNAMFWNAVLGPTMGAQEFRRRSHDPEFALGVLSRAYIHACVIANVDPVLRDFVIGAVPRFSRALEDVWGREDHAFSATIGCRINLDNPIPKAFRSCVSRQLHPTAVGVGVGE